MFRYLFSFFISLCSVFSTLAQDTRLSLSPEYNIPLGKLAWSYKSGMGVQLNFSKVDNSDHVLKAYGISLGYTVLAPLADTVYYVVDTGGTGGASIGKAAFSPFKMLRLQATIDFGIPMGEKLALTLGAGVGILYGSRDMYFDDALGTNDMGEVVAWGTVSPTLGLEFILNEHISLVPYVSYTFMIQLGSTDSNSMAYNDDTGVNHHFYTPGLSLNFNF